MGDTAKQGKEARHGKGTVRTDAPLPKPGTAGKSTPNLTGAYVQSVRVGKAAYARLLPLIDQLGKTTVVTDAMILDGRRALRELDTAIAHTKEVPPLLDPDLEVERDKLVAQRRRLPLPALQRLAAPIAADIPRTTMPRLRFSPPTATFPTMRVGSAATKLVEITNLESEDVGLRELLPTGPAFQFQLRDPWVLGPGESTFVEVTFSPKTAGAHHGQLAIGEGGGLPAATLSAEGRTEQVGFGLMLEISPADVTIPTKHATRDRDGRIHVDHKAVPGDAHDPYEPRITLRNRSLDPVTIGAIRSQTGGTGFRAAGPDAGERWVIAPGASRAFSVGSEPKQLGGAIDTFVIVDPDGKQLGGFLVHGEVKERSDTASPAPLVAADPKAKRDDPKVLQPARDAAEEAVAAWAAANTGVLARSNEVFVAEWSTYLRYTSVNPGIPHALLPGSEIVKSMLSNAFGNFVNDVALKALSKAAENSVEKAAAKVLSAVGAALMASGAGFIVGVLIETAAGLIFDKITSDGENAVAKAYELGETDGAQKTADQYEKKNNELARALTITTAKAEGQRQHVAALVKASTSVADLQRMTAELTAITGALAKARPKQGAISHDLLALWVRGRAADVARGTSDTNNPLWRMAVDFLAKSDHKHFLPAGGGLMNQPDLFVAQCAKEWELRGLPMPPALKRSFLVGVDPADLADPAKADYMARSFVSRFDRQEFVWDDVSSKDKLILARDLGLPPGHQLADFDSVSAMPILGVENGCCVVKKMFYQVVHRASNKRLQARTAPGLGKLQVVNGTMGTEHELFRPSEATRSATLYGVMGELRRGGTVIEAFETGRGTAYVAQLFGAEHAAIHEQHYSGRREPLTVFRVHGRLRRHADSTGPIVPGAGQGVYGAHNLEVIARGGMAMLRGGNTILVVTAGMLDTLGAKSTENDPKNERMRKQRDDEERIPR